MPFIAGIRPLARRLTRSPLFTAVTLLTIAIGIGANSAIFSVVNGVLLKPLPYRDADSLIAVWQTAPRLNIKDLEASPSDYFTFRQENHTLQQFGLWHANSVAITGRAAPEQVAAISLTQGTLDALGVPPALGRWFTSADDDPANRNTVILSYAYWQRKFDGSPSVLGAQLIADGELHVVAGVMPKNFRFLDEDADLFLPMRFDRAKVHLGNFSFHALARLKPGVTLAQANADVERMLPVVNRTFPPPPGFNVGMFADAGIQADLRPLKTEVTGDLGKVLWVLMGSIGVVLLIACANVANLLLVRAEGRQQEIATRIALGASSSRIAADLLIESVALGIAGGVIGLGFAFAAVRLLVHLAPAYLPRIDNIYIDPLVILFTFALSILAGLLFGIIPVWKYATPNVNASLRGAGRGLSQSRQRHRARNTLVVLQTALAVVLLIGAGLMIRTFQALHHVNPGFSDPAHLQSFRIEIPEGLIKDPAIAFRTQQEVRRKLTEIPGVSSVAFANSVPSDGNHNTDVLFAEDHAYSASQVPPLRRFKFVAPGFFVTMGTRLVAGRDLTWIDLDQRRNVTIISENMAREMWGDPSAAIGKRVREGSKSPYREIVGVVADVRDDGAEQKAPATVYWPIAMDSFYGDERHLQRQTVYVLRTDRAATQSLITQIHQAVWSVIPEAPIVHEKTMEEVFRGSMARCEFTLVMLAISGSMALLLGIVGIYGVISYSVSQRTRELGIRIALGAGNARVRTMVVRQGVVLAGIGIVAGLGVAYASTQMMAALLYETSPVDARTFSIAATGLLAAAAIASYIPAYRASTINPNEAFRVE